MFKEAIILAGGFGTRLQSVVNDRPKVLAPVRRRPFLSWILDYLDDAGVSKVILATGYMHEAVEETFSNRYKNIEIKYSQETEPLGTGGAIRKAMLQVEGKRALVMNGDTLFRVNLRKFYDFALSNQAPAALVLREVDDVTRYGAICLDSENHISTFLEKGSQTGKGIINGGVYSLKKEWLMNMSPSEKFSIEKDLFEKSTESLSLFGMVCKQYFIDIGIPEDYEKAQNDFITFEK